MDLKYKAHIVINSDNPIYVYTDWLAENKITEYVFRIQPYKYPNTHIIRNIYFFINLEDAMAFKLAWI